MPMPGIFAKYCNLQKIPDMGIIFDIFKYDPGSKKNLLLK
jgi:hypothetical protein